MSRRMMQGLVIVGGAMAAVACCSTAIALADTDPTTEPYSYPGHYLVPNKDFTVDSLYGTTTGQPGEPDAFQGTQSFTVYDSMTHQQLGSFDALVSPNYSDANPNLEILVTKVTGGTPGTESADVPNVGSVFNWAGADPAHPTNVYADLAGSTPGDLSVTPETDNVVYDNGIGNLWSIWPFSSFVPEFDATAHIDAHTDSRIPLPLPNGDAIVADPNDPEVYSGVTNTSPWAVAAQGQDQVYDVLNPDGEVVGKFTGHTISTGDIFGGHSQEVLVTSDLAPGETAADAPIGMSAGDLPPVGSVFNILFYFNPHAYSMYSDYAADPTAGVAQDEVSQYWNLFGLEFSTHPSFDAVHGFTDHTNLFDAIPYADGLKIIPVGQETYTGINGMPNGGISGVTTVVQGTQDFTIVDSHHNVLASFAADATAYGNSHGTLDEALYITSFDNHGLASADVLPVGSTIEYTDYGWTHQTLEVNTDPIGGDGTIIQTLFTPLGDFNIDPSADGWLNAIGIDF